MEKQIWDWVTLHKKEITFLAIGIAIGSRFSTHRSVAYVQTADGTQWLLPVRKI